MSNEITPAEAAQIAKVSEHVVRDWIRKGKLKGMVRTERKGLFAIRYFISESKFRNWLAAVG